MTTRWARVVRGQFVAAFATFVAAFSHGVVGGGHPPLFAVALALAFSGIACVALAGARLSRLRLGASVAISQLLYHGLFTLFGAGAPSGGAMTSHHHGVVVLSPGAVDVGAAQAADPWMLLAHAGAAVATFVVIVHGENLCSSLATLARLAIVALVRHPAPSQPAPARFRAPTGHRAAVQHRSLILSSSLAHRGPPAAPRFA